MLNTRKRPDRHNEDIPVARRVAFCRCWQSEQFPYCDGTHRKINAETGDHVGPVIVTAVAGETPDKDE